MIFDYWIILPLKVSVISSCEKRWEKYSTENFFEFFSIYAVDEKVDRGVQSHL